MSFEDFASKIGMDTGAGRTWEEPERGERIIAQNERSLGLPADMTAMQFGDKMAGPAMMAAGAGLARQGLGAAVKAIRGVRPPPTVPSPSGLVGPSGAPLQVPSMAPVVNRSAFEALRGLAKNPMIRALGAGATGAAVHRLLSGR
jgi:hypothetical protein